jgi:predicted 3-demethylubiquinone-9 3-methyltransferase (glyoxalase superfamily)
MEMNKMQKITPFLWFDDQAEEAINFYVSIFKNAKMVNANRGPDGKIFTATFQLEGQEFSALNGGPMFKFSPAVSFFVSCETSAEVDELWQKLSEGGTVLMPLDSYPFSEKFGWLQDKYGLSWQLNVGRSAQKITPFLMYVGDHGQAEEAMKLYTSLFEDSRIVNIERFGEGEGGVVGAVKQGAFVLNGQQFMALDGGAGHAFTFTEANSFFVNCESQAEVDELWQKFTAEGEESMCGWLKDKFGVSWQIIPSALMEMLGDEDPEKAKRVMDAMLQMQKIDIQTLEEARDRHN